MVYQMTEQQQLTKILTLLEQANSRLDKLDQDFQNTNQRMERMEKDAKETNQRMERMERNLQETNQRIEQEVKQWDERFFQLVKEQGQTARTIIIAAASVVVLSPVLGTVVDLVSRLASR